MQTAIIGYPRVGTLRELKFATEKYLEGVLSKAELQDTALAIREEVLDLEANGIKIIQIDEAALRKRLQAWKIWWRPPKQSKGVGSNENSRNF
jgi:hypothetical protein